MGPVFSNDGCKVAALILQHRVLFRIQGIGRSDHTDVSYFEDLEVGSWQLIGLLHLFVQASTHSRIGTISPNKDISFVCLIVARMDRYAVLILFKADELLIEGDVLGRDLGKEDVVQIWTVKDVCMISCSGLDV